MNLCTTSQLPEVLVHRRQSTNQSCSLLLLPQDWTGWRWCWPPCLAPRWWCSHRRESGRTWFHLLPGSQWTLLEHHRNLHKPRPWQYASCKLWGQYRMRTISNGNDHDNICTEKFNINSPLLDKPGQWNHWNIRSWIPDQSWHKLLRSDTDC